MNAAIQQLIDDGYDIFSGRLIEGEDGKKKLDPGSIGKAWQDGPFLAAGVMPEGHNIFIMAMPPHMAIIDVDNPTMLKQCNPNLSKHWFDALVPSVSGTPGRGHLYCLRPDWLEGRKSMGWGELLAAPDGKAQMVFLADPQRVVDAVSYMGRMPKLVSAMDTSGKSQRQKTSKNGAFNGGDPFAWQTVHDEPPPTPGNRNNWLTKLAGMMAAGNLHGALDMVNDSLADPLSPQELQSTVHKSLTGWQTDMDQSPKAQAIELNAVRFADFPADVLQKPPFLVGEWLVRGSKVLLTGTAGIGKSMFMVRMIQALVSGKSFCGFQTQFKGRVVYIDAEMPPWAQYARIGGDLPGVEWIFDPDRRFWSHPELFDDLTGDDLLVIDNKSASYVSAKSENDMEHWQPVNDFLYQVKPTTWLLHHAGKEGNVRGSSDAIRAVDLALVLTQDDEDIKAHFVKQRLAEYRKDFMFFTTLDM